MSKVMNARLNWGTVVVGAALALAGCGNDGSGGTSSTSGSAASATTAGSSTTTSSVQLVTNVGLTNAVPAATTDRSAAPTPAPVSSLPIAAPTPTPTPTPTPIPTPTPTPASAVLSLASADYTANQSAKSITVAVSRSGNAATAVSVQYATSDGSGVSGSLYTATHGTLQWAVNDNATKSIVVPISNTTPFSGNESFKLALSNPSADAALTGISSATVTVTGDRSASTLQLANNNYSVGQNAGSVTISVTRAGSATTAASVSYATVNGSAIAGTNYTSASGTLSWAANDSSSKSIVVAIKGTPAITAAATFKVNLSGATGGSTLGAVASAGVNVTPVATSTASTNNASKVLAYLGSLNKGSSQRVLSGQHAEIWNSDGNSTTEAMAPVTALSGQTGVLPAILGLVLNYATNSYAYPVQVTNTLANQWWSKGGLVELSLWSNDPTFSNSPTGAPGSQISSSAFHTLTDKTSAAYAQWHSQLDTYAAALHTLTDSGNVVLLRPFIELNGNWNWYGAQNPADFITVWKDMHDYLMNTKGLKNVLWIYNVNDNVGNYMSYYPGANYVDIVGMDVYDSPANFANTAKSGNMYSQLVATGKPLIMPEVGLGGGNPSQNTEDMDQIIQIIRTSLPNVVGFAAWCQGYAIDVQNGASELLNDPWVINLGNVSSTL